MTLRILLTALIIGVFTLSNAKDAVAQNRAGTYGYTRGNNASGEVTVSNVNARSFRFRIGIGSRNPACIGELDGRADWIAPNVAEYQIGGDSGDACLLIFVFSGNELIIREYYCSGHGASCDFNNTYRRIARRR